MSADDDDGDGGDGELIGQVGKASDDVPRSATWYARVTLGVLYVLVLALGVGAWWFLTIDSAVTLEGAVDLTGPLQLLAWAFLGGSAVFFVGLVLMALPGSIVRVLLEVVDSYNLPDRYR